MYSIPNLPGIYIVQFARTNRSGIKSTIWMVWEAILPKYEVLGYNSIIHYMGNTRTALIASHTEHKVLFLHMWKYIGLILGTTKS